VESSIDEIYFVDWFLIVPCPSTAILGIQLAPVSHAFICRNVNREKQVIFTPLFFPTQSKSDFLCKGPVVNDPQGAQTKQVFSPSYSSTIDYRIALAGKFYGFYFAQDIEILFEQSFTEAK
jgi:hypothetical protein